ncbi:Fpg/Nei family DNA glycosylase [Litchfieldia salsa]|uniref:Formamidopyrimidine-DNA glycosylase n=1 Tax=Litchfieldia salsa TaxID=930152 RepID=A0A1H0TDN4_9BACI|nr:DNA-formamidopyrimidine glycosylase family protein [Litchfieldia salsa]SDP52119.1 DNA-(apurinic or apyrimidinic site) lyase [Litchfieldia salsa]
MPELPEMETYKKLLSERVINKQITKVLINREKSINVEPSLFTQEVLNRKINSIERRGKYLIFHLDSGKCFLLHLMLGGLMYVGKTEDDSPARTKQIIIHFNEEHLSFIGLRLGYLHLHSYKEINELLDKLGPNPLSPQFTINEFTGLTRQRRGILKTTLQNQAFLAGIGNCYTDEICFEARLLPTRKLNELSDEETNRLFSSIKNVLNFAIDSGGYIELPLFTGDQLTGGYNSLCKVYDRNGENCERCGVLIIKESISSKKTYYCSNCQK